MSFDLNFVKVTDLSAITSLIDTDLFYVVDLSGDAASKKITAANVLGYINSAYDLAVGKAGGQTIYGGALTTQGLNIQANIADLTGAISILGTDASTSKTTGAFLVAGGIGVSGDVWTTKINGLTPTASATGFTISGGTVSKTLTVSDDSNISGTNTGDASAINQLLTAYAKGAGTVAATDKIIEAIQKLDGNDDAKLNKDLTDTYIFVGNGSGVATGVAMSGEASVANTGAITLSNSAVIGKVLTGFTPTTGSISDTDTILTALEKIVGNDGGNVLATTLTGFTSGAGSITASDTVLSAFEKLYGNFLLGSSSAKYTYASDALSIESIPNNGHTDILNTLSSNYSLTLEDPTSGGNNFIEIFFRTITEGFSVIISSVATLGVMTAGSIVTYNTATCTTAGAYIKAYRMGSTWIVTESANVTFSNV